MLIVMCLNEQLFGIFNQCISNDHIFASLPPMKEGAMKTTAAIMRAMTKRQQILALNFLPKSWERSFKGFQDHCSLPSGCGKLGFMLGSLLPSPAFLLLASDLDKISVDK